MKLQPNSILELLADMVGEPDLTNFELDLAAMDDWMEAAGYRRSSRHSYKSRLRRFAKWFTAEHGAALKPEDVTQEILENYQEQTLPAHRSAEASGPLRAYIRWAVDSGELKGHPWYAPIEGANQFESWLSRQGLSDSTVGGHLAFLSRFAIWYFSRTGKSVSPEGITRELSSLFLEDESAHDTPPKSSHSDRSSALTWYVEWAVSEGRLEDNVLDPGRWRSRDEFFNWLIETGKARRTADIYASAAGHFIRWCRQADQSLESDKSRNTALSAYQNRLSERENFSLRLRYSRMTAARACVRWIERGAAAKN